jgi:hypothetical protein
MADLTPDQLQKLAEQQKKFNEELIQTKLLTNEIFKSESSIAGEIQKSIDNASALNTKFGIGQDISKQINEERIKSAVKAQKIENDIAVAQIQLAQTKNKERQKELTYQISSLKNQMKVEESISNQIYKMGQLLEAEKAATKEKAKQNDLVEITKNKYKSIAQMFSAAGILAFFTKAILDANQQTTELGKSLGISYKAATGIRQEFAAYSKASGDIFINTNRLIKAQTDLTDQLGIAVQYSGEELATFSKLTEIVGLTADEAGRLTKASAGAGMELQDYVANIRKSAFYAQQATGTHFTDKQILQDVSKLSAGILTKFQGNPKAIAEAVVQAKALGTNLEQIDRIGESLLNWESSISNELEAELITGRQLNLEKARYAALTGTQLDLEKEIGSQVGSLADFQQMNVIAQGSLAKAFGLSRDELADMLLKQEAISKYGSKAAELNAQQLKDQQASGLSLDDYLKKQDQQRSIQEKFNDAVQKLQGLFGDLVSGPLGIFVNMISGLLENTIAMSIVFGAIAGILTNKMLTGLASMIGQLTIATGLSITKAAADTASAEAVTLGAATIPILAGIAAVGGAIYAANKFANGGIVTSEINNATIGEAGPEAIIPLNSPKAANMLGGGGNMDMVVNAIDRLNSRIDNAINRPAVAYIQGENAFAKSLGSNKTLGSSQVQNSYNLA